MKKVLVIGGGAYQAPLVKRIGELGHAAYCVDRDPAAPALKFAAGYRVLDALDKQACLAYARELGVSAVMTYGATITLPTVAYIGERLGLPALPYETAELSKSKFLIKDRLAKAGLNTFGSYFEMSSKDEARDHLFEFPCVVKPSDGSGSKGVSLVMNESELPAALDYASDSARFGRFYCERFIEGEEYSVEAFACRGEVYVYCIVKTTFTRSGENNEAIEYGHRTPSGLGSETEHLIAEEAKKAVLALGVTMGSVNFDVILSKADAKPYIIDCGIRVGQNLLASHLVPLSRGVSVIDNTIRLALDEPVDASPKKNDCVATRLLIYDPGTILEVRDHSELIGRDGILDVILRKGIGEKQGVYKTKSDTCGWVICCGDTPDEAERRASIARKMLKDYIVIGEA